MVKNIGWKEQLAIRLSETDYAVLKLYSESTSVRIEDLIVNIVQDIIPLQFYEQVLDKVD